MTTSRIAIIGAGIAGSACAQALTAAGFHVRLFDKGRRAGGRISTRRADALTFDHGAQYFTARTPAFSEQVEVWAREGLVAPWAGTIVAVDRDGGTRPVSDGLRRWVGTPTMSAVASAATRGLDVTTGVRITALHHDGRVFELEAEDGARHGPFDDVLLAIPAEQAAALLQASTATTAAAAEALGLLGTHARSVAMSPCVAAMIAFDEPLGVTFDGAFVDDDALAWVAKDSSKPGRTTPHETWVLHATPTFSAGHLDGSPDAALPELLTAFARVTGRASPQPTFTSVHRWRYARSADARDVGERWSDEARLGLCGDWCAGDRVEGAFVSGRRLAARLVARG